MIRAIVFDCFGVLASDGWLPFKREHFGHDEKLFEEASDLNKASDSGLIDYEGFISQIAELAHVPRKTAAQQIGKHPADEELLGYIKTELKPNYKIGILSNASENWLSDMFTPEQIELFDAVALSCDMGFTKPDPRTYQTIASKLGVELEECIFIDDQERYCTAATELGMQVIQYKDFASMQTDLNKILA